MSRDYYLQCSICFKYAPNDCANINFQPDTTCKFIKKHFFCENGSHTAVFNIICDETIWDCDYKCDYALD